ncbi:hypothetical protein HanLR1_Chr11g0427011 [Helianthus annuus]|nr:hypothetical protein HanLR1_Chr11g0427011 [Helianthus annuus]
MISCWVGFVSSIQHAFPASISLYLIKQQGSATWHHLTQPTHLSTPQASPLISLLGGKLSHFLVFLLYRKVQLFMAGKPNPKSHFKFQISTHQKTKDHYTPRLKFSKPVIPNLLYVLNF